MSSGNSLDLNRIRVSSQSTQTRRLQNTFAICTSTQTSLRCILVLLPRRLRSQWFQVESLRLIHPFDSNSNVGVGICPTYTISRAILSDAVTLVRGDRFYTVSSYLQTPKWALHN